MFYGHHSVIVSGTLFPAIGDVLSLRRSGILPGFGWLSIPHLHSTDLPAIFRDVLTKQPRCDCGIPSSALCSSVKHNGASDVAREPLSLRM